LEATTWKTIAKVDASRFNPGDEREVMGEKLIGGMGESTVSQAIRRLVLRMGEDRRLEKKVLGIEEEVKSGQLCRPVLIACAGVRRALKRPESVFKKNRRSKKRFFQQWAKSKQGSHFSYTGA
jgi:hypothetical protein